MDAIFDTARKLGKEHQRMGINAPDEAVDTLVGPNHAQTRLSRLPYNPAWQERVDCLCEERASEILAPWLVRLLFYLVILAEWAASFGILRPLIPGIMTLLLISGLLAGGLVVLAKGARPILSDWRSAKPRHWLAATIFVVLNVFLAWYRATSYREFLNLGPSWTSIAIWLFATVAPAVICSVLWDHLARINPRAREIKRLNKRIAAHHRLEKQSARHERRRTTALMGYNQGQQEASQAAFPSTQRGVWQQP